MGYPVLVDNVDDGSDLATEGSLSHDGDAADLHELLERLKETG